MLKDPAQSVSVLLPTRNGDALLDRVLHALDGQQTSKPWDLHVIDSGSTDRTLQILRTWRARFSVPMHVAHVDPIAFNHGETRNLLAAESTGDFLVFLTQDAIPTSSSWLETLTANFDDPRVGAAYSRNVPRPAARILTLVFSEHDPGFTAGRREQALPDPETYARMNPLEKRLLFNFNNVAAAIRRSLWERHPFPRTEFGEDVLMARALIEAGHVVVYDDAATVEHSHEYSPEQMEARARVDGRFNIEWLDRVCVASRSDAETLVARQLVRDRQALIDAGVTGPELAEELSFAERHRRAAFLGLYEGGRSSVRRPSTRMLVAPTLRVLYVVHGFPPDTWAGTEVYTLELAQEMKRRGHEVAVLTRVPAAPHDHDGASDFSVELREFRGLPVWRLTHRLQHQRLRDSYDQPRVDAAFRKLLAEIRPDVVHFQHLIHLSAGLPFICRERGVPSLLTVNDYWTLCARVQLIRPDGVRCEENQGLGCLLCVKERRYERIAAARRTLPALRPIARAIRAFQGFPGLRRLAERAGELSDIADRHDFVCEAYASCDVLLTPSRFMREKLLESGKFDPERLVYSDYGMRVNSPEGFARIPRTDARIRFGFVGSLLWYKGIDLLLRAMGQLDPDRAVLNVFGDFAPERDDHHASLARLAADRGKAVVFHGRFDNQDLAQVYQQIDVLVVPSIWFENSPLSIHEAFLFQTPVVTSDIGGMAELVRDGANGLHFRAGDAADLARALGRFVAEPGLAASLTAFPRIKTMEEDARETETRYRAAACIVRDRP